MKKKKKIVGQWLKRTTDRHHSKNHCLVLYYLEIDVPSKKCYAFCDVPIARLDWYRFSPIFICLFISPVKKKKVPCD